MVPDVAAPSDVTERIRLDSFIADFAARFTAAGTARHAERDIAGALGALARLLRADRCLLIGAAPAARSTWITCEGYADERTPRLADFQFAELFPWHYRRLCSSNQPFAFSSAADLPPDAWIDGHSATVLGIRSMLSVLADSGNTGLHCLNVQCLRDGRSWPAFVAERLRVLTQVFVNLLGRQRISETRQQMASGHADLLESVSAVLWRADAQTFQTSFVSKGAESILGFPVEAWIKIPGFWVEHIHPEDREWVLELTGKATREHRSHDFEYRMVVADGRTIWLRNIVKVTTRDGHAKELIGVTVDITERKRAEIEAAGLRHQLNQALRVSSLGELAATLAHELNQPLGALVSNAEAAALLLDRSQADAGGLHAVLRDIISDAQRAGAILHRVRRLLQTQAIERHPLDLRRLVDDVVGVTRALALSRQIQLTAEIEPALPRPRGDAVQVQQVLINLILNAMDAVAELPVALRHVTVKAARGSASSVELLVADTGRGIDPSAMPRLFEPFFTTKSGGMGMGLPICRTIVESHGGEILVENNTDGGVTVRVRLPLAQAEEGSGS